MANDVVMAVPDPSVSFQWTCPLCGETRIQIRELSENEDSIDRARQRVESALRSHIRQSGDRDHGPMGSYPDSIDPDDLTEYITVERTNR